MAFLSPWFLLGLLGVGIPVAIHMIRRRKAPKVSFTAVRFIKSTPQRMVYFQKVQQKTLLAIRALIIILLVVAFARPHLGAITEFIGRTPRSIVILFDTSMSMKYGDRFAQAKAEAIKIIRSLQPGDEGAVVAFSDSTRQFVSLVQEPQRLERFIRQLDTPENRSTRYLPALRFADQILRSARYPERTVYLISDYQRHAVESLIPGWQLSPGLKFEPITTGGEETFNLAITDVKAPLQVTADKKDYTVLARVRSSGNHHMTKANLSLLIDQKLVEAREIDLSDKSEAIVEFRLTLEEPKIYSGAVTVVDEQFPADNTFYFVIKHPSPINILAINGEAADDWYNDESHWFRLAIGQQSESLFALEVIKPEQPIPSQLDRYEMIVLLNVSSLSEPQLEALEGYVIRGGALLYAVGDQIDVARFNQQFAAISPVSLENKKIQENNPRVISEFNMRHPVFQFLRSMDSTDFSSATFNGYWETQPHADSTVLMRFDNGAPALVEKSLGDGRIMLFASSFDTEWNDLPRHVAYLPLIHETIRYLAKQEQRKPFYSVGEPLPLEIPPRTLLHLVEPNGRKEELAYRTGDHRFYTQTEETGFYRIQGNAFQDLYAVNVPAVESELFSAGPLKMQETIENSKTDAKPFTQLKSSYYSIQLERSQQIWWWILILVVLLGLGEILLANRTHR